MRLVAVYDYLLRPAMAPQGSPRPMPAADDARGETLVAKTGGEKENQRTPTVNTSCRRRCAGPRSAFTTGAQWTAPLIESVTMLRVGLQW